MKIAFYGSSLLSSYWNGAATYYRGLIKDLAARGHSITFYEPDAFERQQHRDMDPPDWARVVVYPATETAVRKVSEEASGADVVVKASGVGVFDDLLLERVIANSSPQALCIFWDVDAPATLTGLAAGADRVLARALPLLDLVFTFGGGSSAIAAYELLGAAKCVPIYNALDAETHCPAPPDQRFSCDLAFLGNRLPDREARVEEFFIQPASRLPAHAFLVAGNGWSEKAMPGNVRSIGHLYTKDHNAFNSTPLAILNIARDSMASFGFSPATRIFEAAGAGACLITDAWEGLDKFLTPGVEVLVARDGRDVAAEVQNLTRERARAIGEAARRRVLAQHTYKQRGAQVHDVLSEAMTQKREKALA